MKIWKIKSDEDGTLVPDTDPPQRIYDVLFVVLAPDAERARVLAKAEWMKHEPDGDAAFFDNIEPILFDDSHEAVVMAVWL